MNDLVVHEGEPQRMEVPAAITPMQMLQMAVSKGADTAQLKELMDLNDRFMATEARKAFVVALNQFKADPPDIFKNKSVSFGTGKTSYKHATLDQVSGVIGAGLAKVGISHRWNTEQLEGNLVRVTCMLTHSLGHTESVALQAQPDDSGSKNKIQAVGSVVTYLQRYTLLAATGMAVKEADDDGKQGKAMELGENVRTDFFAQIDACTDKKQVESLWSAIATACTKAGDIPAYDELKKAVSNKVKSFNKGEI